MREEHHNIKMRMKEHSLLFLLVVTKRVFSSENVNLTFNAFEKKKDCRVGRIEISMATFYRAFNASYFTCKIKN